MSQSILQRNYCSSFIILLTVGILLIDIWVPLGFGIWELYAVPLWLAFRMSKSPPRLIWVVAVMGAFFSVAEIGISRPGGILLYAWFNRSLWAAILCAAAAVLTKARKNEAAMRESEERLRASEERYRLLTQAVRTPHVDTDALFLATGRGRVHPPRPRRGRPPGYRAKHKG